MLIFIVDILEKLAVLVISSYVFNSLSTVSFKWALEFSQQVCFINSRRPPLNAYCLSALHFEFALTFDHVFRFTIFTFDFLITSLTVSTEWVLKYSDALNYAMQ